MSEQNKFEGFILSRQWQDVYPKEYKKPSYHGSTNQLRLTFWIKTLQGPIKVVVNQQKAVFFLPKSDVLQAQQLLTSTRGLHTDSWYVKELKLTSFEYEPVVGFYFLQQRGLYLARDELTKRGLQPLEADVRPANRFLMERFITGGLCALGKPIKHKNYIELVDPVIQTKNVYPTLVIASLDIETSMQGETLYSIAVYIDIFSPASEANINALPESQSIVFMVGDSVPGEHEYLHYYNDEKALMLAFLQWFEEVDPDIIIGWNVINFDLRFLQRKADALHIRFNLGRAKSTIAWRQARDDDQYFTLTIPGRAVLNGIDTLKSATYNFESFSLQYVANFLLGRGKLIHDVDNRGDEITDLFINNKSALAQYNLEDCRLVWEIFQHTQLIQFALERSNMTGLALERFGGSVAAFDNRYLPLLHRKGFVAPILNKSPIGVGSPGGYVMDSAPGLYQNVLVLDFKSLYPSIIRTFKIDPLALVVANRELAIPFQRNNEETENIDRDNIVPGFNGAVFDKESSILPNLIDELWQARDRAKRDKNAATSQAIKILMNSFYGVLGTPGCRFFDARLPSSITLRGHRILTQTKKLVESQGYEVIYGDTDSLFVWLKNIAIDVAREGLFELGEKLTRYLNAWWQKELSEQYNLVSYLELEFETCFSQFVMPTVRGSEAGSKKRYAGRKVSLNETAEDEVLFKGLEAVRTDWTMLAREFQRELYRRIFYHEPFEEFIRETVNDVYEGKCDDKLTYRKRIRRRLDDYQRNVPPHVQAARVADYNLKQEGKPERYARGGWVQYVMTTNGPEPLEYRSSALDYELYVERQIEPIVDGIVQFMGSSFKEIAGRQMGLFF